MRARRRRYSLSCLCQPRQPGNGEPVRLVTGYGAWQTEEGEQASVSESSDRRDLVVAHGQHHDPTGSMDARVRVWEVVAKGGLVVGSGRHELEVLTPEAPTVEELGDDVAGLGTRTARAA